MKAMEARQHDNDSCDICMRPAHVRISNFNVCGDCLVDIGESARKRSLYGEDSNREIAFLTVARRRTAR